MVLLRGTDVVHVEGARAGAAELEDVAAGPKHSTVDDGAGCKRQREWTWARSEVDRRAAVDGTGIEDAAGPGGCETVVERAGIDDRALRVAGDDKGLVDRRPGLVGDRIAAIAGDGEPVVERAGIVDRILAARDAEGLIDRRAGTVRDRVDAASGDREPVVERAGIVDRVLAARDAECLVDERSGLIRDVVDARTADDQAIIESAAVDDRVLTIPADRDLAVDVVAGGGGDAVAAVAGDRDPTVEVAATRDDDRTVAATKFPLIEPFPVLLNVWLDPATVLN